MSYTLVQLDLDANTRVGETIETDDLTLGNEPTELESVGYLEDYRVLGPRLVAQNQSEYSRRLSYEMNVTVRSGDDVLYTLGESFDGQLDGESTKVISSTGINRFGKYLYPHQSFGFEFNVTYNDSDDVVWGEVPEVRFNLPVRTV